MKTINSDRLALHEMHNMYDTPTYDFMREQYGAYITWSGKPGHLKADVVMLDGWNTEELPLLYRHIIAEQLLVDYQSRDWMEITQFNIRRLLRIAELWMHPLAYCKWSDLREFAVCGYMAKEEEAHDRKQEISEVLNYIKHQWVLLFADAPIELENDALFVSMVKGMHMWYLITADYDTPIERVLNGERLNDDDYNGIATYDAHTLRENLTYIAKECGGARAAWLLQSLREEWSKIKLWKCGFENVEEVARFEEILFHGYDDLLAEWRAESPIEAHQINKSDSFCLITDTCRAENKVAEVESNFRAACKGTAAGLWKTIRFNEGMKYVIVGEMPAAKVYRIFEEYFGKLPFSDRAFRDARNKK